MSTKLAKIIADFRTSLATKLAVGAETGSLQSATDDDAVALPTGKYFFTIDGDNSQKEHIVCTLTGTAMTEIKSVSRQGAQTTGVAREHRIGATVIISDFAHIKYLNDLLDGTTDLNASEPLAYDADPDLTGNNKKLATVKLVEDTAMAGGADASTTVKGISKLSVAPASATEPIAVGTNDNRVSPVDLSSLNADKVAALAGTSGTPSSTNKYVTNDDTATAATANKLARRLAGGNITVVTESAGNNSTNAASTAYVDAALGNKKLTITTTPVTLTNSTAETTLFSTTIAANTLSTNNGIRVLLFISDFDTLTGHTLTLKVKYGGTTTYADNLTSNGTYTNKKGEIESVLLADAATNAQKSFTKTFITIDDPNTADTFASGAIIRGYAGTAAEDSTTSLTFAITGQWSNATAQDSITINGAIVEIIK